MTAKEDFWLAMSRGGAVVELDRSECVDLLGAGTVGRLGYVTDDGPRVVPVNYVLAEDRVVFRTTAYGEVARAASGRRIAFEVDDVDEFFRAGWSVLVVGTADLLSEADLGRLSPRTWPEPWAAGPRTLFLQIPVGDVTGRRVLPA
ncbi:MAG: pyridoxamine 5'-phosphate oxidase family protein [Actinomycetes bacterium]